jgi:hypothetical protein
MRTAQVLGTKKGRSEARLQGLLVWLAFGLLPFAWQSVCAQGGALDQGSQANPNSLVFASIN